MFGRYLRIFAILLASLSIVMLSQSSAFCQIGGGGGGAGGGNGGGGAGGGDDGGGDDGDGGDVTGGIEINAEGVISTRRQVGNSLQLNRSRFAAAQASLNKDLQQPSDLRKISLTRLEAEVKKLVDAGKPVPADMRYLAGMTRITHVFYYPETKDIVIAGPAEGYFINAANFVIGMKTGRATLQLQDLVVALRCYSPDGKKTGIISCSIDPTQEGLVNFRETVRQLQRSGISPQGHEQEITRAYRTSLGMQKITINGISTKTHFARVLVEADYEMKLIGFGLSKPAVPLTSFIDKVRPTSANGLFRWFFQPDYDCVIVNPDETAMALVGDGVKLVGEDESVTKQGKRKGTGRMNPASRAYCSSFTKNYGKLAEKDPLWGELRNLIDMSVAAAFIQEMDMYDQAGWSMDVFGDEEKFPVERFEAPTQVEPVTNGVWKSGQFMTPIAGGVNIQPRVALASDRMRVDDKGEIDKVKNEIQLDDLADGQWWWD